VEEEVDGEDHDDEGVEATEDQNLVRDDVAADDQVAGRPPEKHLAAGRHPLVKREREDEPGIDRGAACQRQERHDPDRPPQQARPPPAPLPVVPLPIVGFVCHRPWIDLVTAGRTAVPRARAAESTIRARANPPPPSAANLDIERPFGMMPPKEVRVTKHDADRKVKILDFIAATLRARGFPPSVREIAKAVGLASTSAVHHHLLILEREGYLERGAAQSRAIRLTPTAALHLGLTSELVPQSAPAQAFTLPVIGEIAAGGPIEAYQDASETIGIPDMLAPSGDAYVLKVRGDSMIEAHIA